MILCGITVNGPYALITTAVSAELVFWRLNSFQLTFKDVNLTASIIFALGT